MATIALDATYTIEELPSGIAVYSRRLIQSLAELGSPHQFLVCYRFSRYKQRDEFLRPPTSSRTHKPAFAIRLFQEPWTFWLPWEAQLFHSLAQRPPAFRFRKEIVTIHDIFPITGRNYSTVEFQEKFSPLIAEAAVRAERVITPSQYTAEQLVQHVDVPREKIRVVPEGVDMPARSMPAEERIREREKLVGEGNLLILMVGVLQTRKNVVNALRALEILPKNYRMVLAGGDGHGSEAIHSYIRSWDLGSRVRALGHVPAADLPTLYQAANVLLFPSLEEGFGLPVLEAMASGLPVVASQTSSLPEVGGDAALYVNPHDSRDMAMKVRSVVEDEELRTDIIQKGLARAREFTWQRSAEATLRIYEEVLAT
jgi:glycosyltransferase involved in cell wall biosynthesis